jgi:UDP-glucose 4-epimerase
VNDLAQAHLLSLDALLADGKSTVYNLGSNSGFSVKDVVDKTEAVIGKKVPIVNAPRRPGDPAKLVASSEKIKRELGWAPSYEGLEAIIATAWRWHQKNV